ncbi:MAG: GNAT family N-acetyltransferase [Deltaproteobacteria bacterium]|nr:GNAT family N-acetyltransferase [Deltaproteobacteria bacterium]
MEKQYTKVPETTIRIAEPVDANLLAELGRASFYEAFAEQTAPQDMQTHLKKAFDVDEIRGQLDNDRSLFIIIEADSLAAGYAYLYPHDPPDCVKTPHPIQLIRFYLRKDYYGRNVGRTLMKACLEFARAKGFQSVWLSTWELNHRANAFYKKWDFEVVGDAKFTVGNDVQNDFIFARKI